MKNSISEIEGQRLLKFMEREGLIQNALSEATKVPQSTINKYIKGKLKIPSSFVKQLNAKYKVSFDWFYSGTLPMKVGQLEKKNLLTDIADLKIELNLLSSKLESYVGFTEKLIKDFYEYKQNNRNR